MSIKYILGLFIFMLAFTSCTKELEESPDMGYDYFPIEQGAYISYQVNSIVWDDNDQSVDTTTYQVKMVIDTLFTDNEGRKSYKWNRYTKTDTTDWNYDHTYAFTKTSSRLETVEGNNRFVRLAFPVRLSHQWDVNAFNTKDKLEAKYIDVDVPLTINGEKYSQCAIALLEDDNNLINEFYQEDIYAKGVGLIQRKNIHITKKVTGEIVKGYKYSYLAYDHGKE